MGKCKTDGCKTQAIFGIIPKQAVSCKKHKTENMRDVINKKCITQDCTKQPTYGVEIPTHCKEHKSEEMTDLKHNWCQFDGCKIRPSYGIDKPIFCVSHKTDEMKDLTSKICEETDCKITASFNYTGKPAKFCSKHKKENMINNNTAKCKECGSCANFGFEIPEYCSKHKKENMKDIMHKKCIELNCDVQAVFGVPDGKMEYCQEHHKENMINLKLVRCQFENCETGACFGYKKCVGLFCYQHKTDDMFNIKHHTCKDCNLLYKSYKNHDNYCGYCNPNKQTNRKKKETVVKELLETNKLTFVYDKVIPNNCCLKYRPDFLFKCDNYYIILECDEDAHSTYSPDCEITRMNLIISILDKPIRFIRYNPDKKGINKKQKHKELIEVLNQQLNLDKLEEIQPIYLFY
jgi:hypothetical protein